jgi:hypothetical protein
MVKYFNFTTQIDLESKINHLVILYHDFVHIIFYRLFGNDK